jgi:hypothetical protein
MFGITYMSNILFVVLFMLGFRHKVLDVAVVQGKVQSEQPKVEGEVHNHITKK